jgi:hypothetical protein
MRVCARPDGRSRDAGAPAQEDGGDGARQARGHAPAARDAGEHAREREPERGDDGRDEEGLGGAQGHPQGHVRAACSPCRPPLAHARTRTLEQVERTMEDITDQREVAQQIGNAISDPGAMGVDMDEVRTARVGGAGRARAHARTRTSCRRSWPSSSRTSSTTASRARTTCPCTRPRARCGARPRRPSRTTRRRSCARCGLSSSRRGGHACCLSVSTRIMYIIIRLRAGRRRV